MWPNPQFPADLITFTEELLNGKIHFLSSAICYLMHCSLFSAFRSFLYSDRIWTREFSFSVVLYRESGHIQISKMERFDEIVNGI